jgi:2-keto-4-pentenoate hydratase/2-oxohepta-3-ene-1,7-dioic acid hydratase in catechol pathway
VPRYVRFAHEDGPRFGVVDGTDVVVIDPHPFTPHAPTGERVGVQGLQLLAPVIPSKIVCVGHDDADPVDPAADPILWLEPSSAVIGPGDAIRLPTDLGGTFQHGASLAVVIGALLQRVSPERARAGILGFTAANDVTMVTRADPRRPSDRGFASTGFDTSCAIGPAITTDLDPSDLHVRCLVDGEIRQEGTTADLQWDVPTLVSRISHVSTLLPGDVVLTGTPAGVGELRPGQRVRVEIDGVGVLDNPVVDRTAGDRSSRS